MRLPRSLLLLPTLILAFASLSGPLLAANYAVIDLGIPGGQGTYADPHAINQAGAVAGEWGGVFTQNSFLFEDGSNSNIMLDSVAYGLNDAAVVVGEAGFAEIHGFSYSNGVPTDLGTLAGTYSIAWAVNNLGQIVGESTASTLPNAEVHAVWWHGGLKTDLGILPSGDYSSAHGINDSNLIVGEATVISGTVTNLYAVIYTNSSLQSLGTLPGGDYSTAKAINNAGQIVGEATTAAGETHAFLYTAGVMQDLGTLGGTLSSAAALNNSGQVVGYATTADGQEHAFLYDGSSMTDLNALLPPGSPCTNLITADAINDAGQIAGSGYTATGDYHAFLLTPVPSSLWLTGPIPLGNGQFQLTVNGTPGRQFVLLASPSLSDWTPVSTNLLVTNSFIYIFSPSSTNQAQFYRALLLPPL